MAKLGDEPFIHEGCEITGSTFGRFVEIGAGSRITFSRIGDYSYCDRQADIANTDVGKFANIASFTRIGPTDHPMHRASLHHFLYRSPDYWDDADIDEDFFAHRKSRLARIGHDTWIGHGAVIRPEVTIGDGAVVASSAVVTKDVAPYTIVAGVPAQPIRQRFAPETAERLIALAWWDWSHEILRARLDDFRKLEIAEFLEKYQS
ncbi:chloramphenicol acetyltransferase [Sinisalibacter aestuarii]|uniref:Acetyltransferase n=1 Tax=Sinisalibacter aestuarii TaxID=2949426 RepID=A0ABQ5LNJ0_9RHOB|nr:chloramphenicol acetyltransferase [Sinisalibacter aestuarii]GKY86529.1 acetyltransferase [Sinisalibacter aestuarii]